MARLATLSDSREEGRRDLSQRDAYIVFVGRCDGIDEFIRAHEQLARLCILDSMAIEAGFHMNRELGRLLRADQALFDRSLHGGHLAHLGQQVLGSPQWCTNLKTANPVC